ncbi:helix-turn-helix domain-containing protein [Streptomyces sp. RS10V-4]|uniref:helix-turn-helix domain-containing protein n=1 Tax=Streptomyces rhizoryzae TaxID=2932493 RepID=UPI002003836E|nr:helix-turn-helix transcriptional regulator [Streptomyces rhizoryzae]MCK7623790.1 helix-turn-helix domain-containing protein [Streptomyces rhizoryzae]
MTIEQPAFGKRVREIRRAQGLSQGDLAGDDLSPSYVSLVENGRRVPGAKIARSLAERLGTTVEALCAADRPADRLTQRLGLVGQLVAARAGQLSGDWAGARHQLEAVIAQADGPDQAEVRWEARWELATVLGRLDEPARHEAALRELLDDPLTRSAPVLHARVAIELAQLLRAAGRLPDAVRTAEDAVRIATGLEPGRPERAQAQVALVSASVDSGEWSRAAELAAQLRTETAALPAGALRADALWAAAGARYLAGDTGGALELLAEADELSAATDGVQLRLRLARARTLLALGAGPAPGADALLERSRQAAALVDTPSARSWLAVLETAGALARGDTAAAAAHAAAIAPDAPGMSPLDRARALLHRARGHRADGRAAAAEESFKAAAAGYEAAGAFRLALETWRELSAGARGTGEPDPHAVVMP